MTEYEVNAAIVAVLAWFVVSLVWLAVHDRRDRVTSYVARHTPRERTHPMTTTNRGTTP